MIVAGTGHRPDKLGGYSNIIATRLEALARSHFEAHRPSRVISGLALGWDQAVARAAIDLGIPLTAAMPFEGFDRRWPDSSRCRLDKILEAAAEIVVCHPFPAPTLALQIRNEWMVDRADEMLALWDGSWGGTFNCIQYAEKRGRPVENLWSRWVDLYQEMML